MMHKEELINKTVSYLKKMSAEKIEEVLHYAEFIFSKYEEHILQKGIEKLASESSSIKYLETEENIYTVNDFRV